MDTNLEFLDPFESQALVSSSVFILLLNPNWLVVASGSKRENILLLNWTRTDRPAERTSVSSIVDQSSQKTIGSPAALAVLAPLPPWLAWSGRPGRLYR